MRPGYLRKNGVPYSENARLEEYFETFTEPNGDTWLVDTHDRHRSCSTLAHAADVLFLQENPGSLGMGSDACRADEVR